MHGLLRAFDRAVPPAHGGVDGQHAHAVAARVLHQLRRGIKAHGLRVEQRGQEAGRLVAFEPAAEVRQLGEAVGMAFRKAIFAEAQHLLEDALGEVRRIAAVGHALLEPSLELVHAAMAPPGGHGAAQLVGLAGVEAGGDHGDLHDLLLEDGHAQGALERRAQVFLFQHQRLAAPGPLPRLQIGVDHAALDGSRPHDGHLHHQVVQLARAQARQHAHLRAALDLEHAHGVGPADHVVGGGVFARDLGQAPALAAQGGVGVQAAAQRAQHAEREHVHLQQLHLVQVVLVPLDDEALVHAGGLHRHQPRELALGEHEAAHVLAQVARKALETARQLQPQGGRVRAERHAHVGGQRLQPVFGDGLVEPVVVLGEGVHQCGRHAQGLAHVAQGAARAVADDHGGDGGALGAVLAVDVLDDLFAPVVFEVHVDVRRLLAHLADEALEQQLRLLRIDGRDAQEVAHRRVGRRAAPLAQDALAARKAHDVVHREEVHLVAQVGDQVQLLLHLLFQLWRQVGLVRIAAAHTFPGEPGQRLLRGHAGQHRLQRVAVADLIELEGAALRHLQRGRQHVRRVESGQPQAVAQVALAVGLQGPAAFGHGLAGTDGRDHILQRLACGPMHVHVARGHQRQALLRADALQGVEPQAVVRLLVQFHRQPQVGALPFWREQRHRMGHALRALARGGNRIAGDAIGGGRIAARGQQQLAAPQQREGRGVVHAVAAFGRVFACGGDELAQVAPALHVARQRHDAQRPPQELAAHDEAQSFRFGLHVRPHHAGHRAFVGQRQRGIAPLDGALHQLPGMGGAALEAEVAQAMQLGVIGQHRRIHGVFGLQRLSIKRKQLYF